MVASQNISSIRCPQVVMHFLTEKPVGSCRTSTGKKGKFRSLAAGLGAFLDRPGCRGLEMGAFALGPPCRSPLAQDFASETPVE